ncbi:cell envelope-related function transcriptional attenuator common domain-containing protein [Thalassobacillus cyri]|uniref:Cell envelope-related function transcriptional attenuator common domain-containing protein n=1 Tax=Thalassobacillus cyri TaxID=571932 RepID=A0A1H4DVN8_9BACI|nr:LCP family protein [Thalassobacillus cyri]SEA76667.1 cell envelope-related function transcriptional attenuator common domain-containing protein [Thalassobacillus cyri]
MNRADKRKKKRKRINKLVSFLLILLVTIGGGFGYIYYQTFKASKNSYDDLKRDKSDLRQESVEIMEDPISILLLGVEDYASSGATGRADSIMVVTFNQEKKSMKLVSIPRDTLVSIAGKGTEDKINHSFAFGGPKMTIETVEEFLDIPIDYYATINFEGFENVINIAGGVPVEVPFDFTEKNADKTKTLEYHEGEMLMNGEEALGYARMRKQDPRGDLGRADRQKQVLESLVQQLTKPGSFFKIDELTNEFGNNVTTNLQIGELFAFYKEYKNFNTNKIEKLELTGEGIRLNGVYYYNVYDSSINDVKLTLQEHLGMNTTASHG